jgi:hypothetical protein
VFLSLPKEAALLYPAFKGEAFAPLNGSKIWRGQMVYLDGFKERPLRFIQHLPEYPAALLRG